MYYNKLVEQDRVDALFKPLKKKFKGNSDIEQLEFLFQNCCYNKNRLLEEINRSEAGFSFPAKETLKQIANSIGLKPKTRVEMEIPVTVWADILLFEFHAFVSNIIRCCNFLTLFKLKNVDKIQDTTYVTIGRYCTGRISNKIKDKGDLHAYLILQYKEWIKEVNDIRNEIIHEQIIRKMRGYLISKYERISDDFLKAKGEIKFGIPEYKIENIKEYTTYILGKLESFIKGFFKKYSE